MMFYGGRCPTVDTCLVQASVPAPETDERKSDDVLGPAAFIPFHGNVVKKDGAGENSPLDSGRPYTCYVV
jgi:hypothetical protein